MSNSFGFCYNLALLSLFLACCIAQIFLLAPRPVCCKTFDSTGFPDRIFARNSPGDHDRFARYPFKDLLSRSLFRVNVTV